MLNKSIKHEHSCKILYITPLFLFQFFVDITDSGRPKRLTSVSVEVIVEAVGYPTFVEPFVADIVDYTGVGVEVITVNARHPIPAVSYNSQLGQVTLS